MAIDFSSVHLLFSCLLSGLGAVFVVLLVVCKSWLLLCVFKLARAFYGALNFRYAGTIIVSIFEFGA